MVSANTLAGHLKLDLEALSGGYGLEIDTPDLAMHSLTKGGVLAALDAGVPVNLLKLHKGWQCDAIGKRPLTWNSR